MLTTPMTAIFSTRAAHLVMTWASLLLGNCHYICRGMCLSLPYTVIRTQLETEMMKVRRTGPRG